MNELRTYVKCTVISCGNAVFDFSIHSIHTNREYCYGNLIMKDNLKDFHIDYVSTPTKTFKEEIHKIINKDLPEKCREYKL